MSRSSGSAGFNLAAGAAGLCAAAVLFGGCKRSGNGRLVPIPPSPFVAQINGATSPTTPTGVAIDIVGSSFELTPGTVRFSQGGTVIDVSPPQSNWAPGEILVTVPTGLSAPGTATVQVISLSDGYKSKQVTIQLVATPSFSPSSLAWGVTTALPQARRGHGAVAVAQDASGALLFVIGGDTGAADVAEVLVASLDASGGVGSWSQTTPLPAPRAYAAVAAASATDSQAPVGKAFLYVVGGQQQASGAPGATNTVTAGVVDLASGALTWSATTPLPEARVGARAVVVQGRLCVTGGVDASGNPVAAVASAGILPNGGLASWSEATSLPKPVSFHQSFARGGYLYVVGGDTGAVTDPTSASTANVTSGAWFAQVRDGGVGVWTATASATQPRAKGSALEAGGQVLLLEGVHGSTTEGEASSASASGGLGPFSALGSGALPGLDVFGGAGLTSPLLTAAGGPRFLLIGGDSVSSPGSLTTAVYSTTAP